MSQVLVLKKCKICSKEFETNRSRQTHCSKECAKITMNNNTKIWNKKRIFVKKVKNCTICDREFLTYSHNRLTCLSKECSLTLENNRNFKNRRKNKIVIDVTKKCIICDKEFKSTKNYQKKTCSKECGKENTKRWNLLFCQKRDGIVSKTIICIICNKKFETTRNKKQILICSKKCQKIKIRNDQRKYKDVVFIIKNCGICNKKFNTTKKSLQKTCSKECSIVWQRENKGDSAEWYKKHPEKHLEYHINSLTRLGLKFKLPCWRYQYALLSWSKTIKKIFITKCQICNSTENIISHHIFHKAKYPELSLNINNGITLCEIHHQEVHGWNFRE